MVQHPRVVSQPKGRQAVPLSPNCTQIIPTGGYRLKRFCSRLRGRRGVGRTEVLPRRTLLVVRCSVFWLLVMLSVE